MFKNKKLIIALLIIPSFALVSLLSNYPEVIEQYYSNGLYPLISKAFRFIFGWIPFSFGDIFYVFLIIYALRWLVLNFKRLFSDTKNCCIDVFAAISVVYIAFHLLWGMNYYRLPLNKTLNIKADYTTEQLVEVTKRLIERSNTLHLKLAKNDSAKVVIPYKKQRVLNRVPNGYKTLKAKFNQFEYSPKSIKASIISVPLTYMGFSGYLNPFTNEAQIDNLIPVYKYPTTASHEVAHQIGYSAENEANFIGSLACINHEDKYFNYSGYTFALRFCLAEIYKRDPELYDQILKTVNKGILNNYKEVRDFWHGYQNPLEPIFKSTYSSYLKANKQTKGIESYSYVVALYVNYFSTYGF